jgi:lipopolysaccharide/colanic/teichoic acid biosynthesis glycosyltransferase
MSRLYAVVGKRAIDVVVGIVLGVLTAPLQAACAAAVALTTGRPVFFTQTRAGRDGEPFELYKFRTMAVGTHEASGGYPTSDMVTPIGRLLRKSSLDELPQVLNLVRGEVSLVGPRPALPEQVARYSARQRGRLAVRPGITGLAQVRFRNAAPWSVRIESDLEYVERLSPLTDLWILVRTVPAVLFGIGVTTGQTAADVDDLGRDADHAD